MGKQRRSYTLQDKTRAMAMNASGQSAREIAEITGWSQKTIENWRDQNDPEDWKAYAETLRKRTVEEVQENQIDSIKKMKFKHQGWLRAVGSHSAQLLQKKAEEGTLETSVALDTLRMAIEEEQKLHMPIKAIHGPRITNQSATMGVGMNGKGEVGVVMKLSQMFEQKHRKILDERNRQYDESDEPRAIVRPSKVT